VENYIQLNCGSLLEGCVWLCSVICVLS